MHLFQKILLLIVIIFSDDPNQNHFDLIYHKILNELSKLNLNFCFPIFLFD